MSEHFIPKARLLELVQRKLEAIGVHGEIVDNGAHLRGAIEDTEGIVRHPRTAVAQRHIEFEVVGSNAIRLTAPPVLQVLPPVQFYEFDQVSLLLARIAEQLKRRYAGLLQQRDCLAAFGLAADLDDDRAVVVARVAVPGTGLVVLEADEQRLIATVLELPDGAVVAMGDVPIVLAEYPGAEDLQAGLAPYAAHALHAHAQGTPLGVEVLSDEVPDAPLTECAPPAGILTLGQLFDALGPRFLIAPGVVLRGEWSQGQDRVRLDLRHHEGADLDASVARGGQVVWQGRITLGEFAGPAALIEDVLGVAPPPRARHATPVNSSREEIPSSGTTWSMRIQVIHDDGQEIRYVSLNRQGKRFGAPRVLPRGEFLEMFLPVEQSLFRLAVTILETGAGKVQYQHLDAQAKPTGSARTIDLNAFLSTFASDS
ncbi:MAG: hypothetical protein ABIJ09_15035 [Pseudomonadota bacterium]